jgi:NTE family protein
VRLTGTSGGAPERGAHTSAFTLRAWTGSHGLARPDGQGVVEVPALTPGDEAALRRGTLPPATAAGRALGWAARHLAGLKVGLALGAGAEKGYAHVGVLRTLERAGIPIDYIGGTSVGACIAAGYAAGFTPEEAPQHLEMVSRALFRPTLPMTSLLSSSRLRGALRQIFGERRIEDVPMPLGIVAADMRSRQEVVFRQGPIWRALLASSAIPGIYPPQRIGAHLLVDGAVLNPLPGGVVSEMGADVVLGVRLESPAGGTRVDAEPEEGFPAGSAPRPPSIVEVIMRSIEMMHGKIAADAAVPATLLIEPSFPETDRPGMRRFAQACAYIERGEAAAEAALPRIAAALPWLRHGSERKSPWQP